MRLLPIILTIAIIGRGYLYSSNEEVVRYRLIRLGYLDAPQLSAVTLQDAVNLTVSVYDSGGKLVAQVKDNAVIQEDGPCCDIGKDGIYLWLDSDAYSVEITGSNANSVDISISEYENGQKLRSIAYTGLALSESETISLQSGTGATPEYVVSLADKTQEPDFVSEGEQIDSLQISVALTGNGYVTGDGLYTPGERVRLCAIEEEDGDSFSGWYENNQLISEEPEYSFLCTEDRTLEAKFGNAQSDRNGVCGENLSWTLDGSGLLIISGAGDMWDFEDFEAPWYDYADEITALKISEEVTSIGNAAFGWLHALSDFAIPNSVTRIGDYAFLGCAVESVTIPSSVQSIGANAFGYCDNLTSVAMQEGVVVIRVGAFIGCNALDNIIIPGSVARIDNAAFRHCASLTSVTMKKGVSAIGEWAFMECANLTVVYMPDSVTEIESSAFEGADSLSDVYFAGSQTQWEEISIADGNALLQNAQIHMTDAASSTEIVNVVLSGNELLVQIHCATDFSGAVYSAFYDDNGKMLSVEIYTLTDTSGDTNLTIPVVAHHIAETRVFILDNDFVPQCSKKVLTLA